MLVAANSVVPFPVDSPTVELILLFSAAERLFAWLLTPVFPKAVEAWLAKILDSALALSSAFDLATDLSLAAASEFVPPTMFVIPAATESLVAAVLLSLRFLVLELAIEIDPLSAVDKEFPVDLDALNPVALEFFAARTAVLTLVSPRELAIDAELFAPVATAVWLSLAFEPARETELSSAEAMALAVESEIALATVL